MQPPVPGDVTSGIGEKPKREKPRKSAIQRVSEASKAPPVGLVTTDPDFDVSEPCTGFTETAEIGDYRSGAIAGAVESAAMRRAELIMSVATLPPAMVDELLEFIRRRRRSSAGDEPR